MSALLDRNLDIVADGIDGGNITRSYLKSIAPAEIENDIITRRIAEHHYLAVIRAFDGIIPLAGLNADFVEGIDDVISACGAGDFYAAFTVVVDHIDIGNDGEIIAFDGDILLGGVFECDGADGALPSDIDDDICSYG